jgi:hypothetical protein
MPYTVYKSDGTAITIADNTVDQRYNEPNLSNPAGSVGIQLVGRNAINYGTPTAQNFLQLAENFCGSQEPDTTQPLQGQLWFKKTSNTSGNLYVRYSSSISGVFSDKWAQVITSDNPSAINSLLPSQTGQSGKFLTTNGTAVSWGSPSAYTLPPATAGVLGGIKVGSGLSVTLDGTLSATGGGGGGVSQIIAGTGISISPSGGTGAVTINAAGGGTTYSISAETASGGANLRLTGSDSTIDNVRFAASDGITVVRTGDHTITIGGGLPSQTGNSGRLLTTDGTSASWAAFPNSSAGNGYTTLPGNIRMAWGSVNFGDIYAGHDSETISFGGLFSSVYNIQVQLQNTGTDPNSGAAYPIVSSNFTSSEFTVFLRETQSGVGPYTIFWTAIGVA